jgi:hypothetical protein
LCGTDQVPVLGARRDDQPLAQLVGERGVPLGAAEQAGDVRADGGVRENVGGDLDSPAEVIERAAGAGGIEAREDLVHEDVEQHRAFGRPPPVDGLFAHPSAGGDALNGEPRLPLLLAQFVGRLQDRRLGAGAAALRVRDAVGAR